MDWRSSIVFVFLISSVYSQLYEGKYEGDECELENDEFGICVRLSQCASAIKLVYQKEHPIICSFDRFTPIVCCPTKEMIKARLSERKCSFYKTVELKTTESPTTTPLAKTILITEKNTKPDIPEAPLIPELSPDIIEKNFTSTDFDSLDVSVVRGPDNIEEENVDNNNTKNIEDLSVNTRAEEFTKTENITEEIGTVFIRFNYTEGTSKDVQDPLIILTNISKPDSFELLNTSKVEIKFNQNFTADNENIPVPLTLLANTPELNATNTEIKSNLNSTTDDENIPVPLSILTNIPESADPDIREIVQNNFTDINTRNENTSQEFLTDSTVPIEDANVNDTVIITRGSFATDGEFPHMAALGFKRGNEISWECSGSLVSHKFVLTTAQCLSHTEFGNVEYARFGSTKINIISGSEYTQHNIYKVIRRISHPLYKSLSFYNDIALLELGRPVEFTQFIRPACLHTQEINNKMQLVATGWGLTKCGGNNLEKINLEIIPSDECFKIYEDIEDSKSLQNGIVEEQQFCARRKQGDICGGDGGPLQLKIDDSNGPMYTIIGIKSFGKNCTVNTGPGVYIRVEKYVPWLESIIWPNEF